MHLLTKFGDSRHFQLAKYTVLDQESNVQVKNEQLQRPDAKNEEKLPQKVCVLLRLCFNSLFHMFVFSLVSS